MADPTRTSNMTNTAHMPREHTRPELASDDAHDLIPPWLASIIPALEATKIEPDPLVHVKLFTPDAGWMWYITEYDDAKRLAYGFVRCQNPEMRYISLRELSALRGPKGLLIERDLFWQATPLSRICRGEVR
jgi:DUF2958 family protein